MKHSGDLDVYRVGLGRDFDEARLRFHTREWWSFRYRLRMMAGSAWRRSWWGLWQAEWPGCQRAVRGFTRTGTLVKAMRATASGQEQPHG
jgi:hypothetical protein